jgi:SNF2 family DNA or RNA helicase
MIEIKPSVKQGKWIVKFPYNPHHVNCIKQVGGAKFIAVGDLVDGVREGPGWRIPATLDSYEKMHEEFHKSEMDWDPQVVSDIRVRKIQSRRLRRMAMADTAELTMLPELHPELHEYVSSRGYQLADIAFMAAAPHPLNTNQPGTGKTVETIASVFEAGLDESPVLVVAPNTSLAPVWLSEVSKWVGGMGVPVGTLKGQGDPVAWLQETAMAGGPCWVIVNPEAIKMRKKDGTTSVPPQWAWIYEVDWGVLVIDEFHRMGLNNNQTLAYQSLRKLKADKRIALSGTPMGGQPIKLWSVLNFLYPELFPSKWAFAGNWLNIFDNGFGKTIGDVKKHRREAFSEMMAEFSVRRLKKDIMKWLPDKQYVDRYVTMTPAQKKQYEAWEADGEIEIEEQQLDALSILALYTRLRQFASAVQTVEPAEEGVVRLTPTDDSCKLPELWEILDERGLCDKEHLPDASPVIVFSQFTTMIDMVEEWLNGKGVKTAKITGGVPQSQREEEIRRFQAGEVHVFLMNTNAGGVAITLDRSDTVVFLDETWNPDDQEQAEDRAHRGSKTSQVTIYRIITEDTIEDRIRKGNISKDTVNKRVLDMRGQTHT